MLKADFQISITKTTDQKITACLAHVSQLSVLNKPIPLKIIFKMFDNEYLHLVTAQNKYNFQFVNFFTQRYNYRVKNKTEGFS
ncbi:MAG: hypothetical protein A2383_00670 [Candidatus Pacebacteria bacterium RIFOXYB1_FULL_39_46]|nr:MAG: hypothetical protein A2182_00500 [Candidatus Pacebacteria bacterium RIFOXYA1_FULL_38_18]OGJ38100.1 MAG: hypothetical protein A2383_00670 [Candidatus Pacebacteria bacterium RIFOXYB1_FULL_39_46]OGJ39679.1 MAG: hypothetical protein A2411_02775 [Candidatus Pacebacteria bacterium RIFOXYC1_FULL_39_21]OGJ39852.1 MAG: hypothetical protein A2582_00435 [Candidatus Pacebacteria bacterium RIFOXYD1_FULL_39_27]